jgi:hypothetical protein
MMTTVTVFMVIWYFGWWERSEVEVTKEGVGGCEFGCAVV